MGSGERAINQNTTKVISTAHRLDEDNQLVEFQGIQKIDKLAVLLGFDQVDVVLLETMQSQLGTIVDENFQGLQKKKKLGLKKERKERILYENNTLCGG